MIKRVIPENRYMRLAQDRQAAAKKIGFLKSALADELTRAARIKFEYRSSKPKVFIPAKK